MVPSIMESVCGRRYPSVSAWLYHHARFRLKGKSYPGLVRSPGNITEGLLYTGMDAAAIGKIDAFEGEIYERVSVSVTIFDRSNRTAQTYILRPGYSDLLSTEPWDFEDFKTRLMDRFMADIFRE